MWWAHHVKDKVKGPFQRFCAGTSLHGYSNLGTAKTPFWKFVWWITVLFAAGITLYQMYFTTLMFIDQASITSVESPDEDGLIYPKLGVCYTHWLYWLHWEKAYSANFTKDGILYGMSFLKFIFSNYTFDREIGRQHFVEQMEKNNLSTLTQFYRTFSKNFPQILGSFPVYPRLTDPPMIFTERDIYFKDGEYFMCYTMDGVDIANLLKTDQTRNQNTRSSKAIFNFSMQDLNYNNYKNYVSYPSYNYYMAYWLCDRSNYWVVTLEDSAKDYTNFTLPIRLYPDINNDQFVLVKTEDLIYDILMTPSVQRAQNIKAEPCIIGGKGMVTDNECEKRCNAELDNEINECMFIDQAAQFNLDTTDKLCSNPINFLKYQRSNPDFAAQPCDNFVPNSTNDTQRQSGEIKPSYPKLVPTSEEIVSLKLKNFQCKSYCATRKPCETWRYAITVSILSSSTTVTVNVQKNQTDFNMYYPDASHVLIVVNVDAQTWEGYVANVGGLLGVWTGASMISFLQVPYLCCLADTECCSGKKKRRKSDLESGELSETVKKVFRVRNKVSPTVMLVEDEAAIEKY